MRHHLRSIATIVFTVAGVSCAESTAPATGGLDVSIETIGASADVDPDGYSIVVDSGQHALVAATTGGTHVDLPIGRHLVRLEGLAPNCSITGPIEHSVDILGGQSVTASFTVNCIPLQSGQSIVYVVQAPTGEEIHLINSDGTGARNLSASKQRDKDPAWSPDGKKIAFASKRDGHFEIYVMNGDGTDPIRVTTATEQEPEHHAPSWSPDGKRIAYVHNSGSWTQVYVMNADGTNQTQLTTMTGNSDHPDWSPDGTQIVFSHDGSDVNGLFVMNSDGSNQHQITFNYRGDYSPAWSPDGKHIAYSGVLFYTTDIFVVNPDGTGITQVTHNLLYVDDPAWTPDGTRIAFGSVSGGSCVTVFDDYFRCDSYVGVVGLDGKLDKLSIAPGSNPAWRR